MDENIEILLNYLCSSIRYKVKCVGVTTAGGVSTIGGYCDALGVPDFYIEEVSGWFNISEIKPYLRQMSSMTEKEKREYDNFLFDNLEAEDVVGYEEYKYGIEVIMRYRSWEVVEWLNEHHFDYLGLIDVYGLALEAPEGMYNIK